MQLTRREFVHAAGAAAVGLAASSESVKAAQVGGVGRGGRSGPIAISSANGVRACDKAIEMIKAGQDTLDSIVAGINIVEKDPNDHSVGYGGLPNEDGVVELDSCVMDGPTHTAGAVASLRNIKTPSSVAKLVMRRTDHVLLVGQGALRFARAHGFKEVELLTDEAREIWLRWKESNSDNDDWLGEESNGTSVGWQPKQGVNSTHGTISCMALTKDRDIAGCTSTSGLSYKIPGRVGDSPIIGAGLYVDNEVGACGSTGRGEANLQNCSCFAIVEQMRYGKSPEEAALEILKRVAHKTEPRLRNEKGEPAYGLTFYALSKDGRVGGATMRGGGKMSFHDGKECRLIEIPGLYK